MHRYSSDTQPSCYGYRPHTYEDCQVHSFQARTCSCCCGAHLVQDALHPLHTVDTLHRREVTTSNDTITATGCSARTLASSCSVLVVKVAAAKPCLSRYAQDSHRSAKHSTAASGGMYRATQNFHDLLMPCSRHTCFTALASEAMWPYMAARSKELLSVTAQMRHSSVLLLLLQNFCAGRAKRGSPASHGLSHCTL